MNTWVDFAIFAALIAGIWFVLARQGPRLLMPILINRKPEWVAANGEEARRLIGQDRQPVLGYLLGLASLAVLLAVKERLLPVPGQMPAWERLRDANGILAAAAAAYFAATYALAYRRVKTAVPPSSRRQAPLARRSLDDYVPGSAHRAVLGAVAVHLAAWLYFGLAVAAGGTVFWRTYASFAVLSAVGFAAIHWSAKRRLSNIDHLYGPACRRAEMRVALAALIYIQLWGAAYLYEASIGPLPIERERLLSLALALLVLAAWVVASPRPPRQARPGAALAAVALLGGAIAVSAPSPASAAVEDERVRALLEERVDTHRQSLGMVVGIVDPGGRRVIAHGKAAQGAARPLDGDTLFEIGSITKVFTSLLLADAVVRGEVALDDPVAKFLPASVRVPERSGRQITLLDLATHTSGLPREPANYRYADPTNPFADYTVDDLYAFLSSHELTRDIGTTFDYSNLGAGLLGHALARRAGMDFETLVRTRIAEPLGMRDTVITLSPEQRARLAPGHNPAFEPVLNWDSPTLAGGGSLRSTVNDLLIFLAAAGDAPSPLDAAFALMESTRRSITSPAQAEVPMGWGQIRAHGSDMLFSNGRTGGYRSWIGYDRASKTGVVILTNTDSLAEPDDIGRHLLNPAFPLRREFTAFVPRPQVKLEPAVLDRYVGEYEFAPGARLHIRRVGDRLFARLMDQPPAEIFAEAEARFFYKVVDAQIVFEANQAGETVAAVLHQAGRQQRAALVEP